MKYLTILAVTALFASAKAYSKEFEPEDLVIDGIECTGNALTDCEIIKREIYLNTGNKVNEEEIKNAKIRLQLLNLFKSVNLSLKKGIERGHVVLNVDVVEANPLFSETSITHSGSSSLGTNAGLAVKLGHRNLFGKGKILQGTLTQDVLTNPQDKIYSGTLEYIDPHLFGHKKYFLSANLSRFFINDSGNNGYLVAPKDYTTFAFNLGRRFFDFSHVSIGTLKSYWTQLSRNATNEPFHEFKDGSTAYTINYGWNSEDDSYFPTEGSRFDLTYYKKASGNSYSTLTEFKQNFSLNEKNILSLHLKESFTSDFENHHNAELGFEWAYQLRRAQAGSAVTDARFFVKPSVNYSTYSESFGKGVDAGFLVDSESLGIIKFTTFYRGL